MKIILRRILTTLTFCSFILLCITMVNAQTASYTYPGKPTTNTTATNETSQMQSGLSDAASVQETQPDKSPEVAAANNNFANAQVISGNTGNVSGNTIDATRETGEPNHAGIKGSRSVWYNWT